MKVVVSGHGNFASGILSALTLITGEHDNIIGIDFTEDVTTDELKNRMEKEWDSKGTLYLCDLIGGSPFKSASIIMHEKSNTCVIGGINLGMVIEAKFNKNIVSTIQELNDKCLEASKVSIKSFVLTEVEDLEGDEL